MRPFSADSKIKNKEKKRKIFDYGKTALKKARKSFEKWKYLKDSELFSSLQHRISVEFVKFKTSNDFYQKDSRINYIVDLIKEHRKLKRIDCQIKYEEKFQNHYNLYTIQNKLKRDKIIQYINNYRKKELSSKIIKQNELVKRIHKEKQIPKDLILQRLDEIKQEEILSNKKLKNKLERKDLYLKHFKKAKDKICEMRKLEHENIFNEKQFLIKGFNYEQEEKLEQKRKEIAKKYEDIDNFLYEKELINEHRKTNDNYSIKYQKNLSRINDILSSKNSEKETINQIKLITSFDPCLSGLRRNLYKI